MSRSAARRARPKVTAPTPTGVSRRSDVTGLSAFDEFERGLDLLQADPTSDLRSAYKQLPSYYAGNQVIWNALNRGDWQLWAGTAEDAELIEDGPLFDLFRRPNRAQTWRQFVSQIVVQMHGDQGAAYIQKAGTEIAGRTPRGWPEELRLIPPAWVKPKLSDSDIFTIEGWIVQRGQGAPIMLSPDAVVPLYLAPDPEMPWSSVSPLTPGQLDNDTERMAQHYTKTTLRSGGAPGVMFNYKGDAEIPEEDRIALEQKLAQRYGTPKSSRYVVVSGDWGVNLMGFAPKDMEFQAWRQNHLGVTARLLGITPLMLSYFEGASGLGEAGLKVQRRILYENKILPLAHAIAEPINERIIHTIAPEVDGLFNFDKVEALQEDLSARLSALEALMRSGVTLRRANEFLDLGVDLDDHPWADEWWIPAGMGTASAALAFEQAPPAPAEPPSFTGVSEAPPPPKPEAKEEEPPEIGVEEPPEEPETDSGDNIAAAETAAFDEERIARRVVALLRKEPVARIAGVSAGPAQASSLLFSGRATLPKPPKTPSGRGERRVARPPIRRRRGPSAATMRAEIAAYIKESRTHENAMYGKLVRVIQRMSRRVVRALAREAGVSTSALLRSLPVMGASLSDVEITALMSDDVVLRAAPAELTAKQIKSILREIDKNSMALAIEGPLRKAYEAGGKSAWRALGDLGVEDAELLDFQSKRLPQLVSRYVDKQLGELVRVNDTIRDAVNRSILGSIEDGASTEDMAKRVRDVFRASMERARTIARTETGIAMNSAKQELYEDMAVDEIEWSTVLDGRERPSHGDLNGERVAMGEEFENGLQYPGDPNGDPGEVINCRCTALPVGRTTE